MYRVRKTMVAIRGGAEHVPTRQEEDWQGPPVFIDRGWRLEVAEGDFSGTVLAAQQDHGCGVSIPFAGEWIEFTRPWPLPPALIGPHLCMEVL